MLDQQPITCSHLDQRSWKKGTKWNINWSTLTVGSLTARCCFFWRFVLQDRASVHGSFASWTFSVPHARGVIRGFSPWWLYPGTSHWRRKDLMLLWYGAASLSLSVCLLTKRSTIRHESRCASDFIWISTQIRTVDQTVAETKTKNDNTEFCVCWGTTMETRQSVRWVFAAVFFLAGKNCLL